VVSYYTGFSLRGDAVTVNQVNVVQVWEDADQARVDGVVGVLSPRRTTYDVSTQQDINLRTLPNETNPTGVNQITIVQGEQDTATDIPVDAAILTSFTTSGYIDAPDFDGQATWTLPISQAQASMTLQGEVTNNTGIDLVDAVVVALNTSVYIGEFPAGATESFTLVANVTRPGQLHLGNRVDASRPIVNFNYAGNAPVCNIVNGLNAVYQNVMKFTEFECFGGGGEDDRILRRRALMISAITNEIDFNAGQDTDVHLFAWTDETPLLNIDVSNTAQIEDGSTLYIYEVPSSFEARENLVILPGLMNWTRVNTGSTTNYANFTPYAPFGLGSSQSVAMRFMPMPEVPVEEVTEFTLQIEGSFGQSTISLWNWDTGEWVALEYDSATFPNNLTATIDDPVFIGTDNSVEVLIEAPALDTVQNIQSIRVTMIGEG
jgi:hypothetical protein